MQLHYHKIGHGPGILLSFHGIGQDGLSCFQSFGEILADYYTVYAFDLFFHGRSNEHAGGWPVSEEVITKEQWTRLVGQFLSEMKINRFDVTGFSMGGRFALATLEAFSDRIDQAFLIAPDGVSEHPLYKFATTYSATRGLFRWCMRHPSLFFRAAAILQKAGLVHSTLYRFTQHVMNTPEKRLSIYRSWAGFRKLRFNIPELYHILEKQRVKVFLFTGKYDRLLKDADVRTLSRLLPGDQYVVLQSGHTGLVEKVAVLILQRSRVNQ